jgi:hypothetical protein
MIRYIAVWHTKHGYLRSKVCKTEDAGLYAYDRALAWEPEWAVLFIYSDTLATVQIRCQKRKTPPTG